jgi:hypothetical protein
MNEIGRFLILAGGALLLVGIFLMLAPRIPFLGRLPGDMSFERGDLRIYFPLTTSIILSIILTIVLNLWLRR